jgi:YesN/AraC family two-component response regulator
MVKSILIADDNAFVRQRLGELFSGESGFEVCAVAENGRKAVSG